MIYAGVYLLLGFLVVIGMLYFKGNCKVSDIPVALLCALVWPVTLGVCIYEFFENNETTLWTKENGFFWEKK